MSETETKITSSLLFNDRVRLRDSEADSRDAANSISVVVPVYNSESSLPALVARLEKVLPGLAPQFELILVNDGSRDRSWNTITALVQGRKWVRGIDLMRNYG